MPHRGGGCDRENRTETVFNASQYINIMRKRKDIVKRVNVVPLSPHFPRRNQNDTNRTMYGLHVAMQAESGSRTTNRGPLSLRGTLYIPYTQPGELTVPPER